MDGWSRAWATTWRLANVHWLQRIQEVAFGTSPADPKHRRFFLTSDSTDRVAVPAGRTCVLRGERDVVDRIRTRP